MSTLQVQTLQGPTSGADSNTVRVADNHKLYAKGHVVQVQTYHRGNLAGSIETTSDAFQESECKVTITPQFSNSLIVCDFATSLSFILASSATNLKTRLMLNNAWYGGEYTTGYMSRSDLTINSFQPTVFKTVHDYLAVGTPVEFSVQFRSEVNGKAVMLARVRSSITMTLTEYAQ